MVLHPVPFLSLMRGAHLKRGHEELRTKARQWRRLGVDGEDLSGEVGSCEEGHPERNWSGTGREKYLQMNTFFSGWGSG